jgi:HPt (histidine-containing phosphotransfer) domain-containing protein
MELPQLTKPAASARAQDERPIDLVHLARMTMGDRHLEREVLQLFDRQTDLLVARMRQIAPSGLAAIAHTLRGSAKGIGAWRVARAAEAVESAAGNAGADELQDAIDRLGRAAEEARAEITELLLAS